MALFINVFMLPVIEIFGNQFEKLSNCIKKCILNTWFHNFVNKIDFTIVKTDVKATF